MKRLRAVLLLLLLPMPFVFGSSTLSASNSSLSDVAQPVGSITINRNANVTLTTIVSLNLTATDTIGVSGYYVSTSSATPAPTAAGWVTVTSTQSYSATIPFILASGVGTKTVYAWYKNTTGNVSATASDSIILQTPSASTALPSIVLQQIASGLAYPLAIVHPGDGSGRLFVALQQGKIMIYDGMQILPTPFLDVTSLVSCCGEQGLLGLAFHPSYVSNGFFYINYTNTAGNTVIARYRVSANPSIADPGSAVIILTVDQPYSNHNGGLPTAGTFEVRALHWLSGIGYVTDATSPREPCNDKVFHVPHAT